MSRRAPRQATLLAALLALAMTAGCPEPRSCLDVGVECLVGYLCDVETGECIETGPYFDGGADLDLVAGDLTPPADLSGDAPADDGDPS